MSTSPLTFHLRPKLASSLRGSPIPQLGSRTFTATVTAFNTEAPVKSRAKKATSAEIPPEAYTKPLPKRSSSTPPTKKILKKDLKPPFPFPGTAWTNFVRDKTLGSQEVVGATTKVVAAMWAKMSQAEKDTYAPSRTDWEAYYAKKREWVKLLPKHLRPRKKAGRVTSYALFIKEHYDNTLPFVDSCRAVNAKWRNLDEAGREVYILRARELTNNAKGSQ